MKENLKIETQNKRDNAEATKLFRELDYPYLFADEMFVYATSSIDNTIRTVSFDELRELAKPREYLNSEFELVVTNQPDDGWILVPEGMDIATKMEDGSILFWKTVTILVDSIVWQRNPQQDKVMKEEKKGRFLHQWAYEAFGRGEDVQFKRTDIKHSWQDIGEHLQLSWFGAKNALFRLKPKTIQIGSRTINKPISVKPEMGRTYFIVDLMNKLKYRTNVWRGTDLDIYQFNSGLCHLTSVDAINHCDALLELMK